MRKTVAGLLAGFFVSVGYAQDDAVVITAPRFPQDLRQLPASVTVISEDEISKSAARTLTCPWAEPMASRNVHRNMRIDL